MKTTIVIVALMFLAIYGVVQVSTMYRAHGDLETSVQHTLDAVDENAKDSVKPGIVEAAHKLGIEVLPGDIDVVCENTDVQPFQQRVVSKPLHAKANNLRVTISLHYVARVIGWPVPQQITVFTVRHAPMVIQPSKATQELLDSP